MKKSYIIMFVCFMLNIMTVNIQGQNLLAGWDGNGATGTGSEPNNFGWLGDGVTFGIANGSISDQYANFLYRDYNGERVVVSGLAKTFSFPVNLEAGKYYECSAIFAYFDGSTNGNVPFFIKDGSGNVVANITLNSVVHFGTKYTTGTFSFLAPVSGKYYVSYTNPLSGKRLFVKGFKLEETLNLNLSELSVSTGNLAPAFNQNITSYMVVVPTGTASVNVNAVPQSSEVGLSGTGKIDISSGYGKATIRVKGRNGKFKDYYIKIATPDKPIMLNGVEWNSSSTDASQSMPLVGGDIGCNVWVENGDILVYLQRSGCIDENGECLKIGRFRLKLSPNPFQDSIPFRQELKLENGYVEIEAQKNDTNKVLTKLWVDVHHPVLHVDVQSTDKTDISVAYESWRSQDKTMGSVGDGSRSGVFGLMGYPGDLIRTKDNFEPNDTSIVFYHRNPSVKLFPDKFVELTNLTDYKDQICDDTKNRTFGGMLFGSNLVANGTSTGTYQSTAFQSWLFKSKAPANSHNICVVTHVEQAETVEQWKANLSTIKQEIQKDPIKDFDETTQWWNNFWNRSYIYIQPNNPNYKDSVWQCSRNYQLFRYQLGGNAFGEYPTKFNGGNLTFDSNLVNSGKNYGPDWRQWGGGVFTAQNQRLVYWPMLKSGDFDAILPQFELYRKGLPGAKARVAKYFNHDGAVYPEYATASGLPFADGWGWLSNSINYRLRGTVIPFGDPRATATRGYNDLVEDGIMASNYISYDWEGQIEHSYMILEYHRFTGADISAYLPFIKQSLIFFDKHYRLRQKMRNGNELDNNGKLVLYPSTGCETYRGATNPTDLIAGLKACLTSVINLGDNYVSVEEKAYYQSFLNSIPDYTFGTSNGVSYIKPAFSWSGNINNEQPELYPLFPYNQFKLGDTAIAAFQKAYELAPSKSKSVIGWHQNGIQFARMGMTTDAAAYNIQKLKDSPLRFPSFWGPGYDWSPDHNWGGSGAIALQEMLMQTIGDKIVLFPAWPKDWDVDFKLHAPLNTTVECKLRNGKISSLIVTPVERSKDVVNSFEPEVINADKSIKDNIFHIYPNPILANTFMSVDAPEGIGQIKIFDMLGKLISKKKIDTKTTIIKAPSSAGIYTVSIYSNTGGLISQKFIVK